MGGDPARLQDLVTQLTALLPHILLTLVGLDA